MITRARTDERTADHDHPVRGRFNSWFLGLVEGHVERALGEHKEAVFAGLTGEVAEIGPGNGPNLGYLPAGARLHAIEPNPHFHRRLRREAERHDIEVVLHPTPAEAMDLPDASVDAVISSWVLCTVGEPEAVLAEVRRVLRPGGRFAFVEHVTDQQSRAGRAVQRTLFRPWRWVFEGCHVDRDTAAMIRRAGFRSIEIVGVRMSTPFVPIRPQVVGTARA